MIIGALTEYFTSDTYKPTQRLAASSETGAATIIIGGLSLGMLSTVAPVVVVGISVIVSYFAAGGSISAASGLYGVGISAVGMLSTLSITLATDAYGPVADNAGGIAEMTGMDPEVRERTDALDSLGNTTAATGKGFAIGSAALTALALIASYMDKIGQVDPKFVFDITIMNPAVLVGLFIGGMLPFLFAALTMDAVGKAAQSIVIEVRRQFREIKGIMEDKAEPEYDKCVAISTEASLKKMMMPGAITIISPLLIGFLLGPEALGGFLAGATVSGVLMGIFQNNAGGAWDNAKKSFEKGVEINGEMYYKKSEPHKASVTGDTVGDPFKDTSGPSMNILIKLTCLVGLVIAPILGGHHIAEQAKKQKQEVKEKVIVMKETNKEIQ